MDGGVGFYERVRSDATLKGITGDDGTGDARVQGGWPEDFTVEDDFPLITFLVASDTVVRTGVRRFRVQVDQWAWVGGANGGPAKISAMDERLLALLDEKQWAQGGVTWNAISLPGATDYPGPADGPMRKRRDFDLIGTSL